MNRHKLQIHDVTVYLNHVNEPFLYTHYPPGIYLLMSHISGVFAPTDQFSKDQIYDRRSMKNFNPLIK